MRAIKACQGPAGNDVKLLEVSELTGPPSALPSLTTDRGNVLGTDHIWLTSLAWIVTETAGTYGRVIPGVLLLPPQEVEREEREEREDN